MYSCSIIIPTYDNPETLINCIKSMVIFRPMEDLFHIIIVDNGVTSCEKFIPDIFKPFLTVVRTGQNLGWEGGLIEGLKYVPKEVEFVCFANDDIYIPPSSSKWLSDMLAWFKKPAVAAVGPVSNMVMGLQNMMVLQSSTAYITEYLIGFCMVLRKSALIDVGGVDDTLPGGDDLDLSIRLVDKGYKLVVDRNVFVYHFGSVTGVKLHGGSNVGGGWNSYEMYHATNTALIKKHGFARWQRMAENLTKAMPFWGMVPENDAEGNKIRKLIKPDDKKIYELGCGFRKTIPEAIGVDLVPKGKPIDTLDPGSISLADITADVSQPLPFKDADLLIARHILEHCTDTIETLINWRNALKPGGRVIIAVPDEEIQRTIPINKEHKHGFTKASLAKLLYVTQFTDIEAFDSQNNVSFIITGIKPKNL